MLCVTNCNFAVNFLKKYFGSNTGTILPLLKLINACKKNRTEHKFCKLVKEFVILHDELSLFCQTKSVCIF
jgi:hypothetical protein